MFSEEDRLLYISVHTNSFLYFSSTTALELLHFFRKSGNQLVFMMKEAASTSSQGGLQILIFWGFPAFQGRLIPQAHSLSGSSAPLVEGRGYSEMY